MEQNRHAYSLLPSHLDQIRPEQALSVICSGLRRDTAVDAKIEYLLKGPIDWDYLEAWARRHGVLPLVCPRLTHDHSGLLPSSVRDRLQSLFATCLLHHEHLSHDLRRTLRLFESRGVRAMPLKGPVLAAEAYGEAPVRQSVDLDILVEADAFDHARSILIEDGYTPKTGPLKLGHVLPDSVRHIAYDKPGRPGYLELHRELSYGRFSSRFGSHVLWESAGEAEFGGLSILQPRPEDMLVYLLIHGARHAWSRLLWICDIERLIRIHRDLDWEYFQRRIEELGIVRTARTGLILSADLFGTADPSADMNEIRTDRRAAAIARRCGRSLFADESRIAAKVRRHILYLSLMESNRAAVGHLFQLAGQPPIERAPTAASRGESILFHVTRSIRRVARMIRGGSR